MLSLIWRKSSISVSPNYLDVVDLMDVTVIPLDNARKAVDLAREQAEREEKVTFFQVNGVMCYVDPYEKIKSYEDVFTKIFVANTTKR